MTKSSRQYVGELAFLNQFATPTSEQFRTSQYLTSAFENNVFSFTFEGYEAIEVDFNVCLEDGSRLTDPQHSKLLDVFKCWLCAQDNFLVTRGTVAAPTPAKIKVQQTLHLIDYFLINSKKFKLAKVGLAAITTGETKTLLAKLAASPTSLHSLYEWPKRLTSFLLGRIKQITPEDIADAITSKPELGAPLNEDPILALDAAQLLQARVWLWKNGYYRKSRTPEYEQAPDFQRLGTLINKNTLYPSGKNLVIADLCFGQGNIFLRELPRSCVYGGGGDGESNGATDRHFTRYVGRLKTLEFLFEAGLDVSPSLVSTLADSKSTSFADLRTIGRYKSLPPSVAYSAIKNAHEFCLAHGDVLVDGYLKLVKAALDSGVGFLQFADSCEFYDVLTPQLKELGIQTWAIKCLPTQGTKALVHIPKGEYFTKFRANHGLYELLRVLYGSVYVAVGSLGARRAGELDDLFFSSCLDESRTNLVFANRKSGEQGYRKLEARPIPPVTVRLISMLGRLQSGLLALHALESEQPLFACVNRHSGVPFIGARERDNNQAVDAFCDYFETPLDGEGKRHYLRQHQFRRFFALLFFWGGAFGGLDTLRWFYGHNDIKHIYRYITETITGDALRNVKAEAAAWEVFNAAPQAKSLTAYLKQLYGIEKFSLVDPTELAVYIERLMADGQVEIEPVFLRNPRGKPYRIQVVVKPKAGDHSYA